jgi:pimeloyl-ACP methyl ester carboxylesterase
MMRLQHGRVSIELHTLKGGQGRPLLLLHALGASAETWPTAALSWSHGPIYALDFAGHGSSGHVRGGAYYPEYFLADADLALAQIDEACVLVGAGIGAYVAMMLAGSRAERVSVALLLEGAGLEGGGSSPDLEREGEDIEGFECFLEIASTNYEASTDPLVALCDRDLRPLDYVTSFAASAKPMLFSPHVGGEISSPDWWQTAFVANRGITGSEDLVESLDELESMAMKQD